MPIRRSKDFGALTLAMLNNTGVLLRQILQFYVRSDRGLGAAARGKTSRPWLPTSESVRVQAQDVKTQYTRSAYSWG
jgi:hypothetical protein